MTPGVYSESSTVTVANNVDLRSQGGAVATVTIDSSADVAVRIAAGSNPSELEDFTIDHDIGSVGDNYGLQLETGIARRLFVDSAVASDFACFVAGQALIRDSICVSAATNGGNGIGLASAVDAFPNVTNVTAIATSGTGSGLSVFATANGADVTLTGRNVIAEGPLTDQQVFAGSGASATVNLFDSNFDSTPFEHGSGQPDGTLNTENGNQSAAEQLDATHRQLSNSPTIDAGDSSAGVGITDIDGEERVQGDAVDIGADEFAVPPTTRITGKPKKRTTKRTATFRFTSNDDFFNTFECKLDSKPYRDCDSPKTYRRLRLGKHTFKVRAVDVDDMADPTPASYRWTVRRRR